jgi:peptidoglycan/LPS O-acetylase OafA/YrhL
MSNPHDPSDGRATTHDRYVPALDGLRGLAALLVAGAHYMTMEGGAPLSGIVQTLTGIGMTLFFVLSGFVIHYNYNATVTQPGGLRSFFVARFARLYPLYIVLFLFDFSYTGLTERSACGQIGAPGEHWSSLFFYLTFTQTWLYAVICRASLEFQYGPVAAVSWSISVEVFFYLVYVGLAAIIVRRRWIARDVIGLAAATYFLIVVYFSLCGYYEQDINRIGLELFGPAASTANGYGNSLMCWLLYFNPAARLGEFIAGLAAAHVYLVARQRSAMLSPAAASAMTLTAIAIAVGAHLWLYGVIAPGNSFVGRTASQMSAPLVAVIVYLIARYETPSSRILSLPLAVRLGATSYSIYMLHEILPSTLKRLGLQTPNIAIGWLTWAGALILLVLISSVSYALIEHPARLRIRTWFATQRLPQGVSRDDRV